MTVHFVYLWFDKSRKMFYVGQHSGSYDDQYISSSKWLNGEVKYRPHDFKRRIIKSFSTKLEAQQYEGYLLTLIKKSEWGVKYYNTKQGKPFGIKPWNLGVTYTPELNQKVAETKRLNQLQNPTVRKTTKGRPNPTAAENGKKSASKLSATAKGRKIAVREDGSRYWVYPDKAS